MISDGNTWWKQWFKSIRPWKCSEIDKDKVIWIHIYVVPSVVWNSDFFVSLENSLGSFICLDDITTSMTSQHLIKVSMIFVLEEKMKVSVDGEEFSLVMREYSFGPLRITKKHKAEEHKEVDISNLEDEKDNSFGSMEDYEEYKYSVYLVSSNGARSGNGKSEKTKSSEKAPLDINLCPTCNISKENILYSNSFSFD